MTALGSPQTPQVVCRYRTLGGALVQVTREAGDARGEREGRVRDCWWRCLGCGQVGMADPYPEEERDAKRDAGEHAGTCRSTLADEADGADGADGVSLEVLLALVSVGDELGAIRSLLAARLAAGQPDVDERAVALVEAELAAVRVELGRADAKGAAVAGLGGAALAILAATGPAVVAGPVRVLLAAAGIALAAAVVLAGRALRPRIGRGGFCRWADMTSEDVARHMLTETAHPLAHAAGELTVLSRIARAKFRSLRWAADLTAVGLVLVAAAVVAGVIA